METAQHIEGLSIPVHRSLTQPIMMVAARGAPAIMIGWVTER
ncbi:MAG: hypothetical protein AAFQ15_01800 [Pseudomonadota bacterium]